MQKEVLAMLSELSEVLDEVNFKWWKNPRPVERRGAQGRAGGRSALLFVSYVP
jgi:dimeric dUTPase (all-alpha-NTP-PPase superfamily)